MHNLNTVSFFWLSMIWFVYLLVYTARANLHCCNYWYNCKLPPIACISDIIIKNKWKWVPIIIQLFIWINNFKSSYNLLGWSTLVLIHEINGISVIMHQICHSSTQRDWDDCIYKLKQPTYSWDKVQDYRLHCSGWGLTPSNKLRDSTTTPLLILVESDSFHYWLSSREISLRDYQH